jgi:hypothetical protein
VGLGQWDVERDAVVELEGDDIAQAVACIQLRDTAKVGDAVLEVDDEVALDEIGEVEKLVHLGAVNGGAPVGQGAAGALAAEEFRFG